MMTEKICIVTNDTDKSIETGALLKQKLTDRGYEVTDRYDEDTDLIACVGGDGAFLETIHECNFPKCPIVGINTGHLGFFQEVLPENIDSFIDDYEKGEYTIQHLGTVNCIVTTVDTHEHSHMGLNEITVKGPQSYSIHLDISIGDSPIERFSGDGLLVATSAGSTAYNYSLGGSIVDPRVDLLQVTPIAPMNTTAFRSFTSSILLPYDLCLNIVPEQMDNEIHIMNDGYETVYKNVKKLEVKASDTVVNLIRFKDYDFWNKVKDKFL